MNICEAYQKKLAVSEKVYAKEHGGKALSESKKIAIARVLANTSEYITEAFENSVGTQLSNMKTFKKFCLDLTTVALPSLIANDLVIVFPLKSRTGYIQYLKFTAGSNKGGVAQGEVFNDPFRLGKMNDARVNYTGATIVEKAATAAKTEWPCAGCFAKDENGKTIFVKGKVLLKGDTLATDAVAVSEIEVGDEFTYVYDNIVIPQNDVPQLTAEMDGIELAAKARRIAIYYSQMAAFQAKTEMGVDLGEVLATQACGELSYEIDTEVVNMLVANADFTHAKIDGTEEDEKTLVWSKTLPVGVGKRDHYAGFAEVLEIGSQYIYDKTQKHAANYMLIASNIKPILVLMEGFKAASTSKINGPYYAGELNGVKVYVSPSIAPGTFVLGYNGGDMVTSAAVYAPYMAIVPTQLLGFADGAMSQGFSTLYDLKMLNPDLLIGGHVVA